MTYLHEYCVIGVVIDNVLVTVDSFLLGHWLRTPIQRQCSGEIDRSQVSFPSAQRGANQVDRDRFGRCQDLIFNTLHQSPPNDVDGTKAFTCVDQMILFYLAYGDCRSFILHSSFVQPAWIVFLYASRQSPRGSTYITCLTDASELAHTLRGWIHKQFVFHLQKESRSRCGQNRQFSSKIYISDCHTEAVYLTRGGGDSDQ